MTVWHRLLALGSIVTVSCSVPTPPVPSAYWTARYLAWASDDTLYFQAFGSSRLSVFRWQATGGAAIMHALAKMSPLAGRDGDLLVRDDSTNQFRIYSPQQGQMTTLPLDPKLAQALGWDNAGRMLVKRLDDTCAWTVHALATGSDAGTIVASDADDVALSPGRDSLLLGRGGIRVLPLTQGAPAGVVSHAGQYQWISPRELAVPLPGYHSPTSWLRVDLATGQTSPMPNQPDQYYCLSPNGRRSAAFDSKVILIRSVADGNVLYTIPLKDLPPD